MIACFAKPVLFSLMAIYDSGDHRIGQLCQPGSKATINDQIACLDDNATYQAAIDLRLQPDTTTKASLDFFSPVDRFDPG